MNQRRNNHYRFLILLVIIFLHAGSSATQAAVQGGVCGPLIVQQDSIVCSGSAVALTLVPQPGGVIISWSTGSSANSINVSPVSDTAFYVSVDNGGTVCTDSVHYSVRPVYAVGIDTSICQGQTLVLPWGGNGVAGNNLHTYSSVSGCDSVVNIRLTIKPTYSTTRNDSICQGQTYPLPWGGNGVAGNNLHHYTSVGGCDSLVTIRLTINPTYSSTILDTICQGQTYPLPWGGNGVAGNNLHHYTSVGGCDSSVTIRLTINPTYTSTTLDTICQGQTYPLPWGGNGVAGNNLHHYTSVGGCDSSVTIRLTINPTYTSTTLDTICQGQTYPLPWGGNGVAGNNLHHYTSVGGCDSSVTIRLTINPTYSSTTLDTICQGQTYPLPWGGNGVAGNNLHHYTSVGGCDSSVTIRLTINPTYSSTTLDTICQGQTYPLPWGGNGVAGNNLHHYTSIGGCDSSVTIRLTVNPTYSSTTLDTICQGQTYPLPWGGNGVAGNNTHHYTTLAGCDSTVTISLTIHPVYSRQSNVSICSGSFFIRPNGDTARLAGTYRDTLQTIFGCDSIIRTNLSLKPVYYNLPPVNATICSNAYYLRPLGDTARVAGTYQDTLHTTAGCDSLITTNLTVNTTYNLTRNASICQGDTFSLPNGQHVTTTGTYPVTLLSGNGCDSVINTILAVRPEYSFSRNVSVCNGQSYTLENGQQVNIAGTYQVSLFTSTGCDSILTTHLSIDSVYSISRNDTICQGDLFTLPDGQIVTTAGLYSSSFSTVAGCDSVILTNLHVKRAYHLNRTVAVCSGTTYVLPNGQGVNTPGTYPVMLQTVTGCDSEIVTHVIIGTTITNTVPASICQGQTYTLPNGQIVNAAGTYTLHFTTPGGCDSTIITDLAVHPLYDTIRHVSICQGQNYSLPNGQIVNQAGMYVTTLFSEFGCDSVITTYIVVNPAYQYNSQATICQGESFTLPDGSIVRVPGTFVTTFTTVDGCDSTFTTVLTVLPPPTFSYNADICQGQGYTLPDGTVVTQDGNYLSTLSDPNGCDSLVFVFVTFLGFTPPVISGPDSVTSFTIPAYTVSPTAGHTYNWSVQGGSIVNGNGTDSITIAWIASGTAIIRLIESDSQCSYSDSLVVLVNGTVGTQYPDIRDFVRIYPNPVQQLCTVTWPAEAGVERIYLFDATGRQLKAFDVTNAGELSIDFSDLNAGIYFVKLSGMANACLPVLR